MNKSFIFEKIQPFVDEYACVLLNNKWGVIDKSGNWVIKPKYNYLHSANNCFISKQGNKYGVIDKSENNIIPYTYEDLITLNNKNYLICKEKNKFGIIDLKGNVIIPSEYKYISSKSNNYFIAVKNNKFGCINSDNEIVLPFEYVEEPKLYKDFAIVRKSPIQKGVLNYKNNIVIPFDYEELNVFGTDKDDSEISLADITFSAKTQDNAYIIINCDNKQICEQIFDEIVPLGSMVYGARIKDEWCGIDRFGNKKIPLGKFANLNIFNKLNDNESVSIITNETFEEALINQDGEIVIPFNCGYQTNGFMYTGNNAILMRKNNKFGVIDKNNNVLIPFIFDWIWYEQNNFSGAEIGKKCGYINNKGNPLNIEPIDN